MRKPTLIIFIKPNRIGVAKTRLARDIGKCEARRINAMTTARALRVARDDRWNSRLSVAPDLAVHSRQPAWPSFIQRVAQGGGNLGDRLTRAFHEAPRGQVFFVGTDMPDLTARDIHDASKTLRKHDAVFGPADDGGFWLFGLNKRSNTKAPFDNVRWSSEWALADVRDNLKGMQVGYLQERVDLDDLHALKKWRSQRPR